MSVSATFYAEPETRGHSLWRSKSGTKVAEPIGMRVALISPPFIEVPPTRYGGTELFVGNLACELIRRGHDLTVYSNGDSRLPCRLKWIYPHAEWPTKSEASAYLKNADHTAWAMRDAADWADVLHLNDLVGLPMTRFVDVPTVLTIHHPHLPELSEQYSRYPGVHYVAIANWLQAREPMPRVRVVHHGIPMAAYPLRTEKEDYVAFLGRIAPCKGAHVAIDVARRAGVRLKMAGEIQPQYREYWTKDVEPFVDGRQVEFVGEADRALKTELLAGAKALLFPIQWEEPFGLVMIEALACGTPVVALPGGAVEEVVENGVNGWVCRDRDEMVERLAHLDVAPEACRESVRRGFSVEKMADRYVDVYAQAMASARRPHAPGAPGAMAAGGGERGTRWRT